MLPFWTTAPWILRVGGPKAQPSLERREMLDSWTKMLDGSTSHCYPVCPQNSQSLLVYQKSSVTFLMFDHVKRFQVPKPCNNACEIQQVQLSWLYFHAKEILLIHGSNPVRKMMSISAELQQFSTAMSSVASLSTKHFSWPSETKEYNGRLTKQVGSLVWMVWELPASSTSELAEAGFPGPNSMDSPFGL